VEDCYSYLAAKRAEEAAEREATLLGCTEQSETVLERFGL